VRAVFCTRDTDVTSCQSEYHRMFQRSDLSPAAGLTGPPNCRTKQQRKNYKRTANHAAFRLIFAAVIGASVAACDDDPSPDPHTKLEVIKLAGTCKEDQANKSDDYDAVVRRRNNKTGEISTDGFASVRNPVEHLYEEAQNPNEYHTPYLIHFGEIQLDTNQDQWTLRGISVFGDERDNLGRKATCVLDVVERRTESPDPVR